VIDNFDSFPESISTPPYAQWFKSYGHCKLGKGIRSGQIKPFGQIETLRPLATELWKNYEHQIPREFYYLSNDG
jgi:hypothetical protein